MRKLFDLDNPVFQLIARLSDLTVLGLMCMICCLPVVTIGPAVTALFKTVYDLTLERGSGIVKIYFRAFRDNFKQAVTAWLLALLGFVSLFCDWFLLKLYFEGTSYTVLVWIVLILALVLESALCYLFPLIARYDNTLQEHVRNAVILMIRYFPKTVLMVLIQMLPLLMASYMPFVLLQTLLLWILFCPGFSAQANAFILRPVFDKLERESMERTAAANGVDAEETEEDEYAEEEYVEE